MVEHNALSATREAYDAVALTYAQLFRDTLNDSPWTVRSWAPSPNSSVRVGMTRSRIWGVDRVISPPICTS